MALVTLEEAKKYLRVDSADEDALTGVLLSAAERMCADYHALTLTLRSILFAVREGVV